MRRTLGVLGLIALLAGFGCGSSGGGDEDATQADSTTDATIDGELQEVTPPVVDLPWVPVDGGELTAIKTVRGLACSGSTIHMAVDGEVEGTYALDLTTGQPLTKVFEGTGLLAASDSGLVVATGGGATTAAIIVVAPDGTATDQGLAVEQTEVRDLVFAGGKMLAMAKDWAKAEYLVYRGSIGLMAFEQAGQRTNETGMSFYSDGETLYRMTVLNGTLGSACRQVSATAGADEAWTVCPGFPEFVQSKPSDPYSIKAEIFGSGAQLGTWFRVSNKGANEYHVFVGAAGNYTELSGFPVLEPASWHHTGDDIVLGYVGGAGKSGAYAAKVDGSAPAREFSEGLPLAAHEKDGVVAFCQSSDRLVAAWLSFGGGGSTVSLFQKSLK